MNVNVILMRHSERSSKAVLLGIFSYFNESPETILYKICSNLLAIDVEFCISYEFVVYYCACLEIDLETWIHKAPILSGNQNAFCHRV